MATDRPTFDADLATYVAADQAQESNVTTYIGDVTTLLGLLTAPDFSVEDATVQAAITAVNTSQAAVVAAQAALPPPPGKPSQ
jgi:hypothetical protein